MIKIHAHRLKALWISAHTVPVSLALRMKAMTCPTIFRRLFWLATKALCEAQCRFERSHRLAYNTSNILHVARRCPSS